MADRYSDATQMRSSHEVVTVSRPVGGVLFPGPLRETGSVTIHLCGPPGDYFLSEADEQRMRMTHLADLLQLSPSGLTRRLDGLVRDGLVRREGSEDDRRVMLAVLTDTGLRRLGSAAPVHVESVRKRLIDLLEPAEIEALGTIFAKVRTALDG